MAVQKIPSGYHTVTPYLIVNGAAAAIEFYKRAFGAAEILRLPGPDGRIMHAEIKIGDSPVMLGDECPEMNIRSPQTLGNTPVGMMLYVEDIDAVFAQAIAAGGRAVRPVADQFYGDRAGTLLDPFGHKWTIATHVEDVPAGEIQHRMEASMKAKPA
ncbi:MAG: VOC family protein [Tepidisphaeraceae bacterium]|jgi:PhnB protein